MTDGEDIPSLTAAVQRAINERSAIIRTHSSTPKFRTGSVDRKRTHSAKRETMRRKRARAAKRSPFEIR